MERPRVYFSDLRAGPRENLVSKLGRLLDGLDLRGSFRHAVSWRSSSISGKKGTPPSSGPLSSAPSSIVSSPWADSLSSPMQTPSTPAQSGQRLPSVTAIENGFAYAVVNAPLIIADGLAGRPSTRSR